VIFPCLLSECSHVFYRAPLFCILVGFQFVKNVLANENSSSIASLASRLNYLITKDQFKWYGDFKALICLVKTSLEFTEDGEISEDPAHKMFSFKVGGIIVKWYSSTPIVQTQGSGYAILREKLGNLFKSNYPPVTSVSPC